MQRGNGAVIGKQNTPTTSVATGVWALNEVQRAVLGGTWPSAVQIDPYFEYNTLLLHGNGTNGAQNNTFLDSSTNNFTITRNGNTTQGTFTPYGDNWSNYFGGSDYLSIADNAAFQMGSGAFTIECWFFAPSVAANQCLVTKWADGQPDSNAAWGLDLTSGVIRGLVASGSTVTTWNGTAPATNTWNHAAFVRNGSNTVSLFLNGTRVATSTYSSAINNGANAVNVASSNGANRIFTGYISNARVVKGTAVYDPTQTTITVPTAPLTAVSGTSLLTSQANRFRDASTNAFTITTSGSPSVQRFSPFNPTAAYSAATIGGSGYFDGNGDYLTAAQNAAFNFGTGAFTVEAFLYLTAYPSGGSTSIFSLGNGAVGGAVFSGWSFIFSDTDIRFYRFDGGTETVYTVSASIPLNAWSHLVAVRDGSSNLAIFLNGTRILSTTTSLSYNNVNSDPLNCGVWTSGAGGGTTRYVTGYINGGRIVKGTAVYDPTLTTLTVPTAPLTAITNTSLLLNFTNGGIIDNAMMNDLETVGNAQISTSVSKFGGGSLAFDGSGDALKAPNTQNVAFGTGDFTVEMWVYPNSFSTSPVIFDTRNASGNTAAIALTFNTSGNPRVFVNGGFLITGSSAASTSTWSHLAMVKASGTITLYLNGVSVGSSASSTSLTDTAVTIGDNIALNSAYNGYIDDLRITKGYARYTANFTAPTLPFPDQ